jgi:hypothetical protein
MSANKDYRSDLDMWVDMWDEMQKCSYHPKPEKVQPAPYSSGKTSQDTYYDYFDAQDDPQPQDDYQSQEDEGLLQEDRSQNPVYPDSVGKDSDGPEPAWVSESLLKEVESLKNRLFKLENQMARMGQNKKMGEKKVRSLNDKGLYSEIKSLRSRIDRVSNELGIKDEPSPWKIKRD